MFTMRSNRRRLSESTNGSVDEGDSESPRVKFDSVSGIGLPFVDRSPQPAKPTAIPALPDIMRNRRRFMRVSG